VQALTGPGHGERSPSRLVQRNGYRDRDWRRESGRSSCASPSSGAYRWRRRIEGGQAKSITDLAEQEGVTDAYVRRLLPLTCLAPSIVEAILDGAAAEGADACRDAGERVGGLGGAVRN
jgi:hypothetical protein